MYQFTSMTRICCVIFLLVFSLDIAHATDDPADEGEIIGAGAHFSWVIFNTLKADLEKKTGKKITLYGKNSMLGQGCNAGIKNALSHTHDHQRFGFVCCDLSEQEIAEKHIQVHPLALEPILILVNKENPVSDLSVEQIRDIFSGRITNWADVGGNNEPIVVITRLHCKSRPGHWKTILPSHKDFRKERLNVKSADDMINRMNAFKSAIGHIGSTWNFGDDSQVKAIRVNHIEPTAANLANGKYPFFRKLSAVTSLEPGDDITKLIKEVQTGSAFHSLTRRYQLLPLSPQQN